MVVTPIPRWLIELDGRKPYIEVLNGRKLPAVSPPWVNGWMAGEIFVQLRRWTNQCGGAVAVHVRYYFRMPDGKWSSLVPDVSYMSFARVPRSMDAEFQRPRVAPDIAVEILSPDDRPGRVKRKAETFLQFGSALVLVVNPQQRRVALYRADGSVEERDARGSWPAEPFHDLVLDWDDMYRELGIS